MKVEGKNAVIELFRSNTQIDKLLVLNTAKQDLQNIISLAQKKACKNIFCSKRSAR